MRNDASNGAALVGAGGAAALTRAVTHACGEQPRPFDMPPKRWIPCFFDASDSDLEGFSASSTTASARSNASPRASTASRRCDCAARYRTKWLERCGVRAERCDERASMMHI